MNNEDTLPSTFIALLIKTESTAKNSSSRGRKTLKLINNLLHFRQKTNVLIREYKDKYIINLQEFLVIEWLN